MSFTLQLQGSVVVVGPSWLLASCRARQLQPPLRYQPRARRVEEAGRRSIEQQQSQRGNVANVDCVDTIDCSQRKKARSSQQQRRSRDNIFRSALFAFVRPTPPEWAVDWSVADLSATVTKLGGTIINTSIVNALRKAEAASSSSDDPQSASAHQETALLSDKVCYLVSSGGYPQHQNAAFHPLIGGVMKENLCRVELVTPLWIQACAAENRHLQCSTNPYIFQPQPYYVSRLPSAIQIRVAISGFVGSERIGIRFLLEAIGATYTDNMSKSNTHLISKTNSGTKYQKAIEWGLKVVTVNWLKHIIQYGYCGKNGKLQDLGCEQCFSLRDSQEEYPRHQEVEGTTPRQETVEEVDVDQGTVRKSSQSTRHESVPGSYSSKTSQASAASSYSCKDEKEQQHREICGDPMSPAPSSSSLMKLKSPAVMQRGKGQDQQNEPSESKKVSESDVRAMINDIPPNSVSSTLEILDLPLQHEGGTLNGRSDQADEAASVQACHSDSLPTMSEAETEARNAIGRNTGRRRNSGGIESIGSRNEIPVPMKSDLDSKLMQWKSAAPQEGSNKPLDSSQSQVLWYGDFTQQHENGS